MGSEEKILQKLQKLDQIDKIVERLDKLDTVAEKVEEIDTITEGLDKLDTVVEKVKEIDTITERLDKLDTIAEKVKEIDKIVERLDKLDTVDEKVREIDTIVERLNNLKLKSDFMYSEMKEFREETNLNFIKAEGERGYLDRELSKTMVKVSELQDSTFHIKRTLHVIQTKLGDGRDIPKISVRLSAVETVVNRHGNEIEDLNRRAGFVSNDA
ncbi:MAG: hypothetical protein QM697_11355 [Lachnospiraceae bacterium]